MDVPKDINYKILIELDDKSLVKFCQINKKANKICNDDDFWLQRISYKFPYIPIEVLKSYKGEQSWANYYIYDLRNITKTEKQLRTDSFYGRLDHVMILTNNGIKDPTALFNAVAANRMHIINYLIENGYDVSNDDLIIAIKYGHFEIVKYLVDKGADVNYQHLLGNPLSQAYEHGRTEIANYLIEKGAKVDF